MIMSQIFKFLASLRGLIKRQPNKYLVLIGLLIISLSIVSIFALPPANNATDSNLKVRQSRYITDASKPIEIVKDAPIFTVRLPSNRTTGFEWHIVKYDAKLIKLLKSTYVPPSGNLMGMPGVSDWQFQVLDAAFKKPQQTKIFMEYRRPWEKPGAFHQSMTLTVVTRDH